MECFQGMGLAALTGVAQPWSVLAVYTVRFKAAVFVLHCFQKKSKIGIATPKEELEIIRARLKVAETIAKEIRDGKAPC